MCVSKPSLCTGHRGKLSLGGCFTHCPLDSHLFTYWPSTYPAYWHIESFILWFIDSVTALFIYLTAICSQGCDSNHGSCVAPNTCQCSTGWTGSTCGTGTSNLNCLQCFCWESLYNGVHSPFQFLYFGSWGVALLSSSWFVCNSRVKTAIRI